VETSQVLKRLSDTEITCAVYGVKGGVGTSTVAIMIAGALKDCVYLEMADEPTAWCYCGMTRQEAERSGKYLWYKSEAPVLGSLLIDAGRCSFLDAVSFALVFSKFRVLVTDRSEAAFGQARKHLKEGIMPDLLIMTRAYQGAGVSPEVYAGEFGIKNVCSVPDEAEVILKAQSRGKCPCEFSVELNSAVEEIVKLIKKGARSHGTKSVGIS